MHDYLERLVADGPPRALKQAPDPLCVCARGVGGGPGLGFFCELKIFASMFEIFRQNDGVQVHATFSASLA
jgi:hypothetical protein